MPLYVALADITGLLAFMATQGKFNAELADIIEGWGLPCNKLRIGEMKRQEFEMASVNPHELARRLKGL